MMDLYLLFFGQKNLRTIYLGRGYNNNSGIFCNIIIGDEHLCSTLKFTEIR